MASVKEKTLPINGGYPLHTFEEVKDVYINYIFSPADRQKIEDAYALMMEKHKTQFRKSGEPYYHHLIEVAYIVATLQGGPATIISAFLHDVVEDTDVTIEEINERFGEEVAKIVDALTKIQRLKLSKITSEEFEAEDHRKIFIGMAKDIRVIIIKLADRLHNMRTLKSLSPERQIALSKETMSVFVPIAHRLGLEVIKSELENLCLEYLHPEKFLEVSKLLSKKQKNLNKSLESLKKRIADTLFENNIPFDISARVKSIYSIYAKMYIKGHTFNDIYDILALRIITDTPTRCYEILGLIHKMYRPVPGRFKDYIAMPKPNMYQSLHTTIISGDGNFYEIQIRTKKMDEIAESGVAAHWAYKEGEGYNSKQEQKEIENKLHWFRDFVSLSNADDSETASEYINNLTHDIFESNVYVFTPKGKVIELPQGSTPIDFAYRIHTKVGDSTVGALVNHAMCPLNTVLKTGDVVDIKTSKTAQGPNEKWLEMTQSNQAKSCIRKFLAKKNAELLKEEKILKGKTSCIDAFKDREVSEEDMMEMLNNPTLIEHFEATDLDDLFIRVSNRKPTASAIIDYLKIKKPVDIESAKTIVRTKFNTCPIYVKGADNIAISLANCCSPIPGDDIVGYITQGKGITVHRRTCPNIANENERIIDVFWREDIEFATYPVDILIEANDRPNLLIDIMSVLNNSKCAPSSLNARVNGNFIATFTVTIMVSDRKRLYDIMAIIKSVNGVFNVDRIIH